VKQRFKKGDKKSHLLSSAELQGGLQFSNKQRTATLHPDSEFGANAFFGVTVRFSAVMLGIL
jgi:hypothetical protein